MGKGGYTDFHVAPPLEDDVLGRFAATLKELGFRYLGLSVRPGDLGRAARCKRIFGERGLDVSLRLDLEPSGREELLRSLRRYRGSYEILAVRCANPAVSHVAARDRRVDAIGFAIDNMGVRFDEAVANLCRCALEIDFSEVLAVGLSHKVISRLSSEVKLALGRGVPLIAASGARGLKELRGPLELAALVELLGGGREGSLKSVKANPLSIIERNRQKLSGALIEEGVVLVKAGSG